MPIRQLSDRVEVKASPIHGKGVFAKHRIAKNALVGVFAGSRTRRNGRYVLWVEDEAGRWIGINGNNELRYLNHSRRANATFRGDRLYSLREIRAGAEVTFDYGDGWEDYG